jgi:hypothetical protein
MGIRIYRAENLYPKNQNSSHGPQKSILANQESAIIGSRLGLACLGRIFGGVGILKVQPMKGTGLGIADLVRSRELLGQSCLGNHRPAG